MKPITQCRLCSSKNLMPLFSLGEQYVSDFIDNPTTYEGVKVPINLTMCLDCTLVQLEHTAPQDFMYTRHYWYKSGVTQTMRTALTDIVRSVEAAIELNQGDIVLDIGSNDGTLLRSYRKPVRTIGVEPAVNLAEEGAEGIDLLINDFWSYDVYEEKVKQDAKVITAIGMFYDLENPSEFVQDIALALHEDGVFVAQLMCLRNMLNINDLGNLAHEHLEFYSLASLDYMFGRCGLEIVDIFKNKVNGESYRIFVRHENGGFEPFAGAADRVNAAYEEEDGLYDASYYKQLFEQIEENKEAVVSLVEDIVAAGKKVWVYGASTKGNVILQYYGLDNTLIEAAAERSPSKYGKYTVGTNIPIVSEEEAREANPDYFLVLPYAFIDEFVDREKEWLSRGGKFIVPLPELHIIDKEN